MGSSEHSTDHLARFGGKGWKGTRGEETCLENWPWLTYVDVSTILQFSMANINRHVGLSIVADIRYSAESLLNISCTAAGWRCSPCERVCAYVSVVSSIVRLNINSALLRIAYAVNDRTCYAIRTIRSFRHVFQIVCTRLTAGGQNPGLCMCACMNRIGVSRVDGCAWNLGGVTRPLIERFYCSGASE